MNLHPIDIYNIKLKINRDTADFRWYQQRGVFEERVSSLYSLIAKEEFTHFFDIGANYGYISTLMKKANSTIQVVAVEADPRLVPVINENLSLNNIHDVKIINAIASDHCEDHHSFSINPNSSLDNRVNMPDWQKVSVPCLTLDRIIADHCDTQSKIFLKIDTQGFEQFVLKGAEQSLSTMDNWVLKMEFAPNWLTSQETDPLTLRHYLCSRYQIAEAPARVCFGTRSLDELFNFPIGISDTEKFLEYVIHLNNNHLGWVDLLVRSKQ